MAQAPALSRQAGKTGGGRVGAVARFMKAVAIVCIAGVLGACLVLLTLAGIMMMTVFGISPMIPALVVFAHSVWWFHTHTQHAAVMALTYLACAADTFALIPVLSAVGGRLTGTGAACVGPAPPRMPLRLHPAAAVPLADDCGMQGMTPETGYRHRHALALVTGAALLIAPAHAIAQPSVVQDGSNGTPIRRHGPLSNGEAPQADCCGHPEDAGAREPEKAFCQRARTGFYPVA